MMKNYKKLIFKERRYSFRHEREAKEEKIIYVPYEVSNPGHNNGGTREKARGGLEPPTHSPPFKPVGVFLLLVWHRHSLPTTGSHITTQLMFSLVTGAGGGGGWERGELAGVSWEVILDPQLKILKSALHELCRLWQVLYLLLLPAVPKVSC